MKRYRLPGPLDFVRISTDTVEATQRNLVTHYSRPPSMLSYASSYPVMRYACSREISLPQITSAFYGHPGARFLSEVIGLIWSEYEGTNSRCYSVPAFTLQLRADLVIPFHPAFYRQPIGRVNDRTATLVRVQPRKTFALSQDELRILKTLDCFAYLKDDFEGASYELLDLSAPVHRIGGKDTLGTVRVPRLIKSDELEMIDLSELEERMQIFADAWDTFSKSDFQRPVRKPPKKRPSEDAPEFPDFPPED